MSLFSGDDLIAIIISALYEKGGFSGPFFLLDEPLPLLLLAEELELLLLPSSLLFEVVVDVDV